MGFVALHLLKHNITTEQQMKDTNRMFFKAVTKQNETNVGPCTIFKSSPFLCFSDSPLWWQKRPMAIFSQR